MRTLLLILCLAIGGLVVAQSTDNRLVDYIELSERELMKPDTSVNFGLLFRQLILAGREPDMTDDRIDRLYDALSKTIGQFEAFMETRVDKQKAEKELANERQKAAEAEGELADLKRRRAERVSKKLYGIAIAEQSRSDLDNGAIRSALVKAHYGLDSLTRDTGIQRIPPQLIRAFGNSVTHYFMDTLGYYKGRLPVLAASDDQHYLTACDTDSLVWIARLVGRQIEYVDTAAGIFRQPLPIHQTKDQAIQVAVAYRGHQLATASHEHLSLYRLAPGPADSLLQVEPQNKRAAKGIVALQWVNDSTLLTADRQGQLLRWNTHNLDSSILIDQAYPFVDLQVTRNGSHYLVRSMRSAYYGQPFASEPVPLPVETEELLLTAQVTADGSRVVASDQESGIRWWPPAGEFGPWSAGEAKILHSTVNSDRSEVYLGASSSAGMASKLLMPEKYPDALVTLPTATDGVMHLAAAGNAPYYAAANYRQIWFFLQDSLLHSWRLNNDEITQLTFHPTQPHWVLLTTRSGRLALRDITTEEHLIDLSLGDAITGFHFDAKGDYVYLATASGLLLSLPILFDKLDQIQWDWLLPGRQQEIERLNEEVNPEDTEE